MMSQVHEQITNYYLQMEKATSEDERLLIKQARQEYYDQLSQTDKKDAREAAKPFLEKLIQLLEREADPMLKKTEEMLERINARNATAYTTESAAHPVPRQ